MANIPPELQGALITLAITVVTGLIGSGIEWLGNKVKNPFLVALGKKLEAGPNDIPKLLGKRAPDPALLNQPPSAP